VNTILCRGSEAQHEPNQNTNAINAKKPCIIY
jgi:hypothetical protein